MRGTARAHAGPAFTRVKTRLRPHHARGEVRDSGHAAATPARDGDTKVRLHPLRLLVAWVLSALALLVAA